MNPLVLKSEEQRFVKFVCLICFQVDEPYTYSLIYDNKKVASILEPHNTALSPDTAYGPFTGESVHVEFVFLENLGLNSTC